MWPGRWRWRAGRGIARWSISAPGCIYDGGSFSEADAPNFTGSFYALCKAAAEQALQPFLDKSYILRIRIPFGRAPHAKNYLSKLRAYPKLVDVANSLSCVEDVAKVAVHFALHRPPPGLYNACNPGVVTTRDVVQRMGLRKDWFDSYADFAATVKAPRSNCLLDPAKLQRVYPLRPVGDALEDCIGAINDSPREAAA